MRLLIGHTFWLVPVAWFGLVYGNSEPKIKILFAF